MKVLLLKRLQQEASIWLESLTEEGRYQKFKIPGVLKSKNRNAYFLTPGAIWEFTILQSEKAVVIPREMQLVETPFSENVDYQSMAQLAELLRPLCVGKGRWSAATGQWSFFFLETIVAAWQKSSLRAREASINCFWLNLFAREGLLHLSLECELCSRSMQNHDYYHISEGSLCQSCFQAYGYSKDRAIPWGWMHYFLNHDLQTSEGLPAVNIERYRNPRSELWPLWEEQGI